ncbi:MAG: geranylgeranylglyceryl/heptaprenylglyceryl phosphate synthase [Salinivirgaceae bacterium]|nr:geranylgeranylglyceryl/heptaprenylglyceryl phosphate synthase [Salinivirgaceae bacterium]
MHFDKILEKITSGKKALALLIDPDKHSTETLIHLVNIANTTPQPDVILVGGSIVFNGIEETIATLKEHTSIPIFIFPGNAFQVAKNADGILLLSLISGRNPEFLIGNHVLSAPLIKKHKLEIIPTGYMLINSGTDTSVLYMSNTSPIPYRKNDIAIATALAGEQLGLKMIYLEAGSGAEKPVSNEMISAVKENLKIPIIVGGGIKTKSQLEQVLNAGADIVVIGTAAENTPEIIREFSQTVAEF